MVNEYGEQLVFVHNGRMGLLFHDDDLMPRSPMVLDIPEPLSKVDSAAVCVGYVVNSDEASWLRKCIDEVRAKQAAAVQEVQP